MCVRVLMLAPGAHYSACLFLPNLWPMGYFPEETECSADDFPHQVLGAPDMPSGGAGTGD